MKRISLPGCLAMLFVGAPIAQANPLPAGPHRQIEHPDAACTPERENTFRWMSCQYCRLPARPTPRPPTSSTPTLRAPDTGGSESSDHDVIFGGESGDETGGPTRASRGAAPEPFVAPSPEHYEDAELDEMGVSGDGRLPACAALEARGYTHRCLASADEAVLCRRAPSEQPAQATPRATCACRAGARREAPVEVFVVVLLALAVRRRR